MGDSHKPHSVDLGKLTARLEKAIQYLSNLADDADSGEQARLRAKASGVRLALSYLSEWRAVSDG